MEHVDFDNVYRIDISEPCIVKVKGLPDQTLYTVKARGGRNKISFTINEHEFKSLLNKMVNMK